MIYWGGIGNNNPCSRGGSYIFKAVGVGGGGRRQNSVFIKMFPLLEGH